MPLNKKVITNNTQNMLTWLACLPCVPCGVMFGICLCQCCESNELLDMACYPCSKSTLEEYANSISFAIDSLLTAYSTSKLTKAFNIEWEYSRDSDYMDAIRHAIRDKVYYTLNNFNFGNIESSDLNGIEREYIVTKLADAILDAFPSKAEFDRQLSINNISRANVKAYHAYFSGAVISIVNSPNFIHDQLNTISGAIENARTAKANITPERLAADYQAKNVSATPANVKGLVNDREAMKLPSVTTAGMYKAANAKSGDGDKLLTVIVVSQQPELLPPPYRSPSHK